MGLPNPNSIFPPTDKTLQEELDRYGNLYAARSIDLEAGAKDNNLGTTANPNSPATRRVKANLCADIAQTAASLLIGNGISCTFENPENEQYVEALLTGGLESRFLESAETASVYGGAFLRLVADPTISPTPYVTVVEPNRVAAEWVDGTLIEATTWTEIRKSDGGEIVRFVETRNNKTRTIECGVFVGNRGNLGAQVPLNTFEETAHFQDTTRYPAGVDTMVAYWSNGYPNRRYPWLPIGRSDFQGSESLLAAADLAVTEAVRDLRLSRTRVIVPSGSLKSVPTGDRETYTELDGVDPATGGISIVQGNIRSQQIQEILDGFKTQIVSDAGYAPQSFGLGDYGSGESGTALRVRERRTISTTEAKRRLATPAIENVVRNLLALANTIYGEQVDAETPTIVWPEIVTDDPLATAQTITSLLTAGAISIRDAVRRANPDITDEEVEQKTRTIYAERGLTSDLLEPSSNPYGTQPGF